MPPPPNRTLRKRRSHRLARPRGGWAMGTEPVDGSIGRPTPSRPLVGSGVRKHGPTRQLAFLPSMSRVKLLLAIEIFTYLWYVISRPVPRGPQRLKTMKQNSFRHRSCVHSLLRSPIDIFWLLYAYTLRLMDRRIATTSHLHDLKITLTSTTLMEYPPTSIHRGFCSTTSPMVGSTPSISFAASPKLAAHCISLYTRDLDAAGYDLPRRLV